jgi:hypothetical protein
MDHALEWFTKKNIPVPDSVLVWLLVWDEGVDPLKAYRFVMACNDYNI